MNYKTISKLILALIIGLTSIAFYILPGTEFDYDFESYFPRNHSEIIFFSEYRKQYESDNDFLLIILDNKASIFDSVFLANVNFIEKELKKLVRIESTYSPVSAKRFVKSPFGYNSVSYLHYKNPQRYISDSTYLFDVSELPGTIISNDAKSMVIYLKHEPYLSKVKSDELLSKIENILNTNKVKSISMAGRIHGQHYFIQRLRNESGLQMMLALVLVSGILIFFFRSFWTVSVSIAVVLIAVLWLLAIMVLFGKKIDILANLIPTIIFIVGMSDVVHIMSKYLEELRNGKSKTDSIKLVLKEVGTATFLTSLTTAIGFLSLIFIEIKPIKDFAIYTALGVLVSYILAFTLLPSILFLSAQPKMVKRKTTRTFWYRVLHTSLKFVIKNYKVIPVVFLGLMLLGIFGVSKIKLDNYLLEDLNNDDPIKKSYIEIGKNFAGSRPLEISIQLRDSTKSFLDTDLYQELQKLDSTIIAELDVSSYSSPYKIFSNLIESNSSSPSEKNLKKLDRFVSRNYVQFKLNKIFNKNLSQGRFSGRIKDFGGLKMREFYAKINSLYIGSPLMVKNTGTAYLIDTTNKSLVKEVIKGLLLAVLLVSIIMGFIFKSIKMILISMIPNLFPLIVVGSLMYLFEIDLKISTSIIFTIAFGIAVDDTIHFMTKLKLELNKGKSLLYGIKRTYLSTGKAIILTSIILSGGFVNLIFSNFNSIYYIGVLVGISLISAVLADLILLPALLIIFYGKNNK